MALRRGAEIIRGDALVHCGHGSGSLQRAIGCSDENNSAQFSQKYSYTGIAVFPQFSKKNELRARIKMAGRPGQPMPACKGR
jgi:hypothetical protein